MMSILFCELKKGTAIFFHFNAMPILQKKSINGLN